MIFIHLLLGIILGKFFGNCFFFILGSIFPDIDHIYVVIKYKLFNSRKFVNSIKFEKKYNIKYKTPLFHSLLGLILFSLIICLFNKNGAIVFSIAYLLHLLLDWMDIDEKYYFYPLKIKFRGFLPIWSRFEQILTILLIVIILILIF
ncbi:MAG: metal-dependent hydrolase [Nanoarchaeota archaeon]